ncbi:hypothetical protein Ait01nite_071860 [Actinoplanes italicus]|uniref:DNA polymerase III subunit gamma/tau n=1 Tax=Actinoplanes italicus TaxID=113567 RepID=A0A2T0KAV8_9ACTN|nr:DNA polymerase III subunit gamma and tau [Actinoplanes italicus]PRX20328.1 DNA polymerase-3 subunit gamma/tau [Actinoplanes italicus]GIE34141.1 hypothetical protein Ait01nite_071860 [Actinoplanes italicus]
MALALYRKYRPRTFAEIIGQEHVTEPLSQALRSGRLNHAYLFSGPRGCGKTSSARILARSLNCEQGPTPEPCGVCGSCKSLANDGAGSIDVIEIDAASHGGVDDARELREKAFFAPANSRYKIYVIDEAHMVSSAGFNALLKLVEEPPDYVKFIFATTEPDKVLGTIRSRTHHYPFRLIPPAVLRPYLQQLTDAEGITVEPSVLPLVVRAGGGSARDSLSILDQLIAGSGPEGVTYSRAVGLLGVTDVTLIDEMCDAVANGDGAAAYATIDRVAEAGHEPRRFASDLLERFRDLIVLQQVPDAVAKGLIDGPADQLEAMAGQAHRLGAATLSRCADILHNGLVEMRGTTAPRLLLELVTARMLLPGADASASALLQRLERLERGVTLMPSGTGQIHSSDVRGEHPPTDAGTPIARVDEDGSAGGPAVVGNAPAGGGPGGGGKAAAMAAAAAARAGSARPSSARPVSPAAPAPAGAAASAGSPAHAPSPGVTGPAPSAAAASESFGEAATATASAGSDTAPASAASGAGAVMQPGASAASGGSGPRSRADGPSDRSAVAPGSAPRHDENGEPDWNRVADGGGSAPVDAGYYDEAPPWDEEPPEDEPPAPVRPQAESRPATRPEAESRVDGRPQADRHPVVRPEAESDPAVGPDTGIGPVLRPDVEDGLAVRPDARLERVRAAWQALGQNQPKVRAMQDYGIGVRDLEGDTIVFAAPTQALVERFLNWREAITTEFRKSPGGDWRIRCEVGTAGPAAAADPREQSTGRRQPGGAPGRPAQQPNPAGGSTRNTGRTESHPPRPQRAPAADSDEDWPEPARPAVPGSAPAAGDTGWPEPARPAQRPAGAARGDDASWSEPARPGAAGRGGAGQSADRAGPLADAGATESSAWPEPVRPGSGAASTGGVAAPAAGGGAPAAGPGSAAASGLGAGGGRPGFGGGAGPGAAGGGSAFGGAAVSAPPSGAGSAPGGASRAASGGMAPQGVSPAAAAVAGSGGASPAAPVRSAAAEAARAALANARSGVAARPAGGPAAGRGAAGGPAAGRGAGTPSGSARSFSDAPPVEEAPYDPEYDGPAPGYEGFDPGDEPLDDVIDEKTARQSGEEQAIQLLRAAFGAEKIGEL